MQPSARPTGRRVSVQQVLDDHEPADEQHEEDERDDAEVPVQQVLDAGPEEVEADRHGEESRKSAEERGHQEHPQGLLKNAGGNRYI